MLDTIRQAIASDEFLRAGLRLGSVALGEREFLVGVIWWKRRPIPIVGLLWAAAGWWHSTTEPPSCGWGWACWPSPAPRSPVYLCHSFSPLWWRFRVPGWWRSRPTSPAPTSFPWLTFGVIVVGAPLVALAQRHMGDPLLGLLPGR